MATVFAATVLALAGTASGQASDPYARIVIAEPQDQATISDKTGAVQVRLILEPPLRIAAGDQIRIRLDERVLRVAWSNAIFTLEDLNRGPHTMQALVTDARGVILGQSAPVQFNVGPASTSSSAPIRAARR